MKKFIKKSFLFLVVIFIVSSAVEQLIFFAMKNIDKGDLSIMNKIVGGKINAEILICGSSRAYVNFNPKMIEDKTGMKSFNIGLNGSRLGVQLPILKTYLKYNDKPKILIQEVGFGTLAPDERIYAPYRYLPYLFEDEVYSGLRKVDENLWMQKYLPPANMYFLNADFLKIFFEDLYISLFDKKDYLIKGYHPNPNRWSLNIQEFIEENKQNGIWATMKEESINDLREIIEICLESNIQIILVKTPEYYRITPLQMKRKEIIKKFNDIARIYNIKYLDYSHCIVSKEKRYFYDFTHLNNRGSILFSEILGKDLLSITNK